MAHPFPSESTPTSPLFNVLIQEAVDVVLEEMNIYFEQNTMTERYKANLNNFFDQLIFISAKSPESDRFLPAIIVDLGNMEEFKQDLGNFLERLPSTDQTGADDGSTVGARFGGSTTGNITCTVASLSSSDLDRITDLVFWFWSIVRVPQLQQRGVKVIPNTISMAKLPDVPYESAQGPRSVLRREVVVGVWLEWFVDILDTTNPTISQVRINLVSPGRTIKVK